jgi:hypothetical protein
MFCTTFQETQKTVFREIFAAYVKSNDKIRVETYLTHIFTIFVLEMGRGWFETVILAKEVESF